MKQRTKKEQKGVSPSVERRQQKSDHTSKDSFSSASFLIKKLIIRSIVGFLMLLFFVVLLRQDHEYVCVFVVFAQILVFKELITVRFKAVKEKNLWGFRTQQWYFLGITLFFYHGKSMLGHFSNYLPHEIYGYLYHHHIWMSFVLYVVGFCGFIFSLRGKTLKYQISQMTWTVMTLLLVVVQTSVITRNIFEGLIWFLLPVSLIICNDIMAYFCGVLFGKKFTSKPLTPLSPNKTWEGFIGAALCTLIFAVYFTGWMSQYDWFVCPASDLKNSGTCKRNPIFLPKDYMFPESLTQILETIGLPWRKVHLTPMILHATVFAVFASLIAPFGGFFMSAVKRAYKIKDFDNIFPGHGGMTDRMDCQLIMGLFTFAYFTTFVKSTSLSAQQIIDRIFLMPLQDKELIIKELTQHLQRNIS
eukprot:TRINITY_DN4499_c0_g1_i1.p1 TRINITY_DN4499_c0_g1~~TRINITY_DN4499_c0_g1_i1.p1  ORF type:complete len:438 (-),score=58.50 TRINITY_DN4499_c0_g1_i1:83-1330(-)